MNHKRYKIAVSEIIGTFILLAMVISAFSIIYFQVLSDKGPEYNTFVKIGGKVEGRNVILEHKGGELLDPDTELSIVIAGIEYNGTVDNWLIDSNSNGKWNLGERLLFPFEYDIDLLGEYDEVDVEAVDKQGNSIIFMGPIDLNPISDIGIEVTIDNLNPIIGEHINITINVTSYGGDLNGSGNVKIKFLVPEGLVFNTSSANQGLYNNGTGIWDVGNVLVGQPATLRIELEVVGIETHEFTQLAMVLDGSGSIDSDDWDLMKEGLEKAVKNDTIFPHDESVELTVVQFGNGFWPFINAYANVEIPPTIITDNSTKPGYYLDIANDINNINQLKGYTPTGCGLRLGADQIRNEGDFHTSHKQVIILVTDGKANCEWIPGGYTAEYKGETEGKSSAEAAREYSLTTLDMEENQDELDSIAIGSEPEIPWINNSIVWPQPGYIAPPYLNGSGWVNHVQTWQDFENAVNELFKIIFQSIIVRVDLSDSTTFDPNPANDIIIIYITPE